MTWTRGQKVSFPGLMGACPCSWAEFTVPAQDELTGGKVIQTCSKRPIMTVKCHRMADCLYFSHRTQDVS